MKRRHDRTPSRTQTFIFIIRIVHDTASNAALRSFVTTRGTERLRRRVSLPVDPSRGGSGLEVMCELCEFTGHAEFYVYRS